MSQLILNPIQNISGIADFDYSATNYEVKIIGSGWNSGFVGARRYTWKMWLDQDSGYHNRGFIFRGNTLNGFNMFLYDSSIYFNNTAANNHKGYSIEGMDNKILEFDVTMTSGALPNTVKINGSEQFGVEETFSGISTSNNITIGYSALPTSLVSGSAYLKKATIWDFISYNTDGVTKEHGYMGLPDATENASWDDYIGTLGILNQNIEATRNIAGIVSGKIPSTNIIQSYQGVNKDVLKFDGSSDVDFGLSFATTGQVDVSCMMFIDEEIGTGGRYTLFALSSNASHCFIIYILNKIMWFQHSSSGINRRFINLETAGMLGKNIGVQISKTSGDVWSLSVDGVAQTLSFGDNSSSSLSNGYEIGSKNQAEYLRSTYIWDIHLANHISHYWKGYKSGNANSGWVDQLGSNNGAVNGSPDIHWIKGPTSEIRHNMSNSGNRQTYTTGALFCKDGSSFVKISYDPPSTGDYSISLDCYIDNTAGPFGAIPYIVAIGTNMMGIKLLNNRIHYFHGNTFQYQCDIPYDKSICHMDLIWKSSPENLDLYINNIEQPKESSAEGAVSGSNIWLCGWHSTSPNNMRNFSMWNLDLNGEHFYKGYPSGNTISGWTDQIGTWHATIEGPGPHQIRDILH